MKTTIALLVASVLIAGAPTVAADETTADCEPGQGWIGYTSSDQFEDLYNQIDPDGMVLVCEGEHWDGQDTVQPDNNPGYTGPCAEPDVNNAPDDFFIGLCMDSDPNKQHVDPVTSLTPVGLRVSGKSQGTDNTELFVATEIFAVGHAHVYAGQCSGGAAGLEGAADCGGSREARSGVYLRDDSPSNVLATVVSALGITRGYVSEGDCDQATYQEGAENDDRTKCGRDNTAISAEFLLP